MPLDQTRRSLTRSRSVERRATTGRDDPAEA